MVTWRDSFLLFGGYQSQLKVQQFNLTTQEWKVLSEMPVPRATFGCAAFPNNPDKILLVGGDPVPTSTAIYNPASNTWEPAASTSIERKGLTVVQFGDRLVAIGGQNSAQIDTDTSEEYDVATNSWSFSKEKIVRPKMHIAALVIPKGDVPSLPEGC